MKPIKLSICIPSLHSRSETLLDLLEQLRVQDRYDEVEVLVLADSGTGMVGDKRNRILAAAAGEYICWIDDDDEVAEDYIPKLLAAIDANPGVDAVALRGECTTGPDKVPVLFDYRLGGREGARIGGVLWRSPGHLCPIRAPLAKSVKFPLLRIGEDLPWSAELAPLLTTCARAGDADEVLYRYRLDGKKTAPRVRAAAQAANKDHEAIFTRQYTDRSGPGSTPDFTAPYRTFLETFIRESQVRTILDLGCGDLEVMSRVDLGRARYRGVDVIKERVQRNDRKHPHLRFEQRDIRTWEFPRSDLVICKDVVQHWSTAEVTAWLELVAHCGRDFKYLLVTNCNYGATVNTDILSGGWRAIDLTARPFSIGEVVFSWGTPNKDVVLIRGSRR